MYLFSYLNWYSILTSQKSSCSIPFSGITWGWVACSSPDSPPCPSCTHRSVLASLGFFWVFFFCVSRTFPDHHDFSKTVKTDLTITMTYRNSVKLERTSPPGGLWMSSWWTCSGSRILDGWKACVILDTIQRHGWYQSFGTWFNYCKYCLYLPPSSLPHLLQQMTEKLCGSNGKLFSEERYSWKSGCSGMVSQPFDFFLEAFQKLSGFSSHTIPSRVSISNRTESGLLGDGEGKECLQCFV